MNDQEVMQALSVIEEVVAAETKPKAAVGASFGGALDAFRAIVQWLRANGINLGVILANLQEIIEILTSGDAWSVKVQRLIEIFFSTSAPRVSAPEQP